MELLDEDKGLYTIGTVADLIDEHPETLRVWEKNGLILPDREGYQRKYSNNDLKRLKFIKYLMDEKGLNIAGVRHVLSLYGCWFNRNCRGGATKNSAVPVNELKECWRIEGSYCLAISDKAEVCKDCFRYEECERRKE